MILLQTAPAYYHKRGGVAARTHRLCFWGVGCGCRVAVSLYKLGNEAPRQEVGCEFVLPQRPLEQEGAAMRVT
jgi:hypothetical protein